MEYYARVTDTHGHSIKIHGMWHVSVLSCYPNTQKQKYNIFLILRKDAASDKKIEGLQASYGAAETRYKAIKIGDDCASLHLFFKNAFYAKK